MDTQTADGGTQSARPTFTLPVHPIAQLDMVLLLDNSNCLCAKAEKLKAQLPNLIAALKDPTTGALPDMRIALLDSDLGSGGMYASGRCGPKTLADGTVSKYGDMGRFQMNNAASCGVTDKDAVWLEYTQGKPVNFAGDISTVLSCLVGGMTNYGCFINQTLESFEYALATPAVENSIQRAFLRSDATLALIFLSEQDDCSAATNDGMFGDKSELAGEVPQLRCATRGYACNGQPLSTTAPGYPTTSSFAAPLSRCSARTDSCPNPTAGDPSGTDTSVPTSCSPLRGVKSMADKIKALKIDPGRQILVAGILGWPLSDSDLASSQFTIAPVPTVDPAHPTAYSAWPVCYDPNYPPSNPDPTTGFDGTAWAYAAPAGIRLAAYVDQFGSSGLKFSVCQSDLSTSASQIGQALARRMREHCLPASYTSYASCVASYLVPDSTGNYVRQTGTIPTCDASNSRPPCYTLSPGGDVCADGGISVTIDDPASIDSTQPLLGFYCQ